MLRLRALYFAPSAAFETALPADDTSLPAPDTVLHAASISVPAIRVISCAKRKARVRTGGSPGVEDWSVFKE